MTDITLSIMVNAATHDLSYDKAKEAYRWQNMDIMNRYNTVDWATFSKGVWKWNEPISSHRMALVHITNYPENDKSFRLFDQLTAAGDKIRRRKHKVVLPASNQADIDADKETTWNMPEGKDGPLDEIDIVYTKSLDPEFPDDASKDTVVKSKNGEFR